MAAAVPPRTSKATADQVLNSFAQGRSLLCFSTSDHPDPTRSRFRMYTKADAPWPCRHCSNTDIQRSRDLEAAQAGRCRARNHPRSRASRRITYSTDDQVLTAEAIRAPSSTTLICRPLRVKVRSPGVQPAGRLYPQLRTCPCTAQTDALCQEETRRGWTSRAENSYIPSVPCTRKAECRFVSMTCEDPK